MKTKKNFTARMIREWVKKNRLHADEEIFLPEYNLVVYNEKENKKEKNSNSVCLTSS